MYIRNITKYMHSLWIEGIDNTLDTLDGWDGMGYVLYCILLLCMYICIVLRVGSLKVHRSTHHPFLP